MDTFASIGRRFATPQLIVSSVVGVILVVIGILLVTASRPAPPPPDPASGLHHVSSPTDRSGQRQLGIGMIVVGCILPLASWARRALVRKYPTFATFMGMFDVGEIIFR